MKKAIIKFVVLITLACLGSYYVYHKAGGNLIKEEKDIFTIQKEKELEFKNIRADFNNPEIIINPYDNSPLTALIRFQSEKEEEIEVTVVGKNESHFNYKLKKTKDHYVPIIGLYPDKVNDVFLRMGDKEKNLKIKTGPLPDNFSKRISVKENLNSSDELYILSSKKNKVNSVGYDGLGNLRWYFSDNYNGSILRLQNKRLLISSDKLGKNKNTKKSLYEIDMLGKVYKEYLIPADYKHEVIELKNKNFLILVNSNNLDLIYEIDRKTGKVIKIIDLNKIFKKANLKIEVDKINSLDFDEDLNNILISFKDMIVSLNYNTYEISYLLNYKGKDHKTIIINDNNFKSIDYLKLVDHDKLSIINNQLLNFNDNSEALVYKLNLADEKAELVFQYKLKDNNKIIKDFIILNNKKYIILDNSMKESLLKEIDNNEEIYKLKLNKTYDKVLKTKVFTNEVYDLKAFGTYGNFEKTKYSDLKKIKVFNTINEEAKGLKIDFKKEKERLIIDVKKDNSEDLYIIFDKLGRQIIYKLDNNESKFRYYINDNGIKGHYKIYLKYKDKIYNLDKTVNFN